MRRGFVRWLAVVLCGASLWTPAAARQGGGTVDVDADPVRCWWRSDRGAIQAGEPFSVVLTCAVVETDAVRVVVDRTRLEPSVLTLPPFDLTGGAQAADTVAGVRRFFQYRYDLNLINENAIGRDVLLPDLSIGYRIESRTAGTDALQGRDQTYQMPPLPLRVVSLVATDATDIREPELGGFAAVEARELRARLLQFLAMALYALALLLVVAAARRMLAGRATVAAEPSGLPDRDVLAGASSALSHARQALRHDLADEAAAVRALAALRIIAAYAAGRSAIQTVTRGAVAPLDGQLLVRGGWLRSRAALVTASATAGHVTGYRTGHADLDATRLGQLNALGDALAALTRARYGADGHLDGAALEGALEQVAGLVEALIRDHGWLAKQRRATLELAAALRERVWTR
jgi:hypothetical protein